MALFERKNGSSSSLTMTNSAGGPTPTPLPLAGMQVVEFSHTVMGPSCGVILADLGADVIKVEPAEGEPTRRSAGFASGFFPYFNRNKRSLSADLKSEAGRALVLELL